MMYEEVLSRMSGCPFCTPDDRSIAENRSARLVPTLAPYHEHHLIIVSRRHIESVAELTDEEVSDVDRLIRIGSAILSKLGYDDFTLLVRNGHVRGKSVPHLHYHLIPRIWIGSLEAGGLDRPVLSTGELGELLSRYRNLAQGV